MSAGVGFSAATSTTAARHELKAVTESNNLATLRTWLRLHSLAFISAYPSRQVNNIYFDTPDLASFAENLAGSSRRYKVRLRWYGTQTEAIQGRFEIKFKRDRIGWKQIQQLATPVDLRRMSWHAIVTAVRAELSDELRVYLDGASWPVIINQYLREYYSSFDGRIRATLDREHVVYAQLHYKQPNLEFALPRPDTVVLELKAHISDLDALREAADSLPIRIGRSSKYADAVDALLT